AASAGSTESQNYSIAGYGLFLPTPQITLTGLVSFGQGDHDTDRVLSYVDNNDTVSRTIASSTDSDEIEVAVSGLYEFVFDSVTITPSFGINYYTSTVDAFTEDTVNGPEGLNFTIDETDIDSVQTSLGVSVANAVSTGFGIFVPEARARWIHEFEDDSRTVTGRYAVVAAGVSGVTFNEAALAPIVFQTNAPDADRFEIGGGGSATFFNGLTLFVDGSGIVGHENVSGFSIVGGARMQF
ncbi:MAG: autotransporter outer membrane beta-barrel domain-containing protein, partial [Caulobacterales bacterium]|nr:autotransporter outer membrane beta-barrel domain-containing protein [Caulobacterales bacterium]